MIGTEVGVRLPTGRIETQNYNFAEYRQGLGTGTFVPTARILLFSRAQKHGWMGFIGAQNPLYENKEAYRTGYSFNGNLGYWLRWRDDYLSMLQIIGRYQTSDTWHSLDISQSHRSRIAIGLMQTVLEIIYGLLVFNNPSGFRSGRTTKETWRKMTIFSLGLTWL